MLNNKKILLFLQYTASLAFAIITFLLIMIIKRHIIPSQIVFYEGIYMAFFYFCIIHLIKKNIYTLEKCIIGFLICFIFWSLVPTIVDRSVSITVIGSLRQKQRNFKEINSIFISKYVYENDAVKKRLVEQISNGNVIEDDNKNYSLTKKGMLTAHIIDYMAKIFNVNDDFISP